MDTKTMDWFVDDLTEQLAGAEKENFLFALKKQPDKIIAWAQIHVSLRCEQASLALGKVVTPSEVNVSEVVERMKVRYSEELQRMSD